MNHTPYYRLSAFRHFAENERHITRIEQSDVLILGISGVLRFTEDGVLTEIRRGEYYIQRRGLSQSGPVPSDTPEYFFIHFNGTWKEDGAILPARGRFDIDNMMPMISRLDRLEKGGATVLEKCGILCNILTSLFKTKKPEEGVTDAVISRMITYLTADLRNAPSLEEMSREFHFCTNYLINIFRRATGQTPHAYLKQVRLRQARLMLTTGDMTAQNIAMVCGFSDYPHFFRIFVAEYGMSPTEYRKSYSDI